MPRLYSAFACLFLVAVSVPAISLADLTERDPLLQHDGHYLKDLSQLDRAPSLFLGRGPMGKASTDSFYVYGGPDSQLGRFETAGGAPDTQGWASEDLTEVAPHWRASTTNAATLGNGTLSNHAVICHSDAVFGLEPYTGYGNYWDDWLVLRLDLAALGYDPTQDSVDLRWDFDYVYDTEQGYDFFVAEWSQAGAYQILLAATGTSYNDSTAIYEPVHFDSDVISLSPSDYYDGEIWLRLRVVSDTAWSDADDHGGFTTEGRGAAGVDDIKVYVNEVLVSYAGWEPLGTKADLPPGEITGHDNGAEIGTQGWLPTPGVFVGDFSRLFAGFQDIDPCRENRGWQYGFIDDGTPPSNDPQQRSTGGSVSSTWSYGVSGGWVVNYTGGLSNGTGSLNNRIVSPEIDWDLPGTADDDAWGCIIGADVWNHMPLTNCIFNTFELRTWTAAEGWGNWISPGWLFFSNSPVYLMGSQDVTRILTQNPEKIQLRLGVQQVPGFSFCQPTDATPAPLFDNIFIIKYVLDGPVLAPGNGFVTFEPVVRDHFPNDGTLDGSIRWDWSAGTADSIVIEMLAVNPGTQLADPVHGGMMQVALLANPEFGDHGSGTRAAALQSLGAIVAGQDNRGWPIYTFAVQGAQSTWADGSLIWNSYYFDLPDGPAHPDAPHQSDEDPLFFRGDVIHYYIEALDDAGGRGQLPADITGFLDFEEMSPYHYGYVVRGFPVLNAGEQTPILFWDLDRSRAMLNRHTLRQAGIQEGVDFDLYTGTWLAGRNGMSLEQISGYEVVIANECAVDSSEVTQLLDWHGQEAARQVIWMGRTRAAQLQNEATGQGLNFLNNVLGVDFLADSVRDIVDGQRSPGVVPVTACMSTSFSADAKCPVLEDFNHVGPTGSGAEISHEFVDASGAPYMSSVAAGITWDRQEMGFDKSTAFFPFRLGDVWDLRDGTSSSDGASARAHLLRETLECMGKNTGAAVGTGPPPLRFAVQQNIPNPFNPSTRISYSMARRELVQLVVYDLHGRKVRTLVNEPKVAGTHFIDWDSTDDSGTRVASGIYHYRLRAGSFEETKRMVLIK